MNELSFLFQKMITVRLKNRIIFVITCFVTTTELFIHFTYLAKNLVTQWIEVTATGLEPTTTPFINEHSTKELLARSRREI